MAIPGNRSLVFRKGPVSHESTVGAFLEDWLDSVSYTVAPRTFERYAEYVRLHALPTIGGIELAELSPQHIQQLYGRCLALGASPTSVLHLHRVMHRALGQAARWGIVERNVTELVDPPRPRRHEMQTLCPDEARRFLDTVGGHRLEALFVLAITCGLRQGELLALRWRDVDLDRYSIAVTGSLQRGSRHRAMTIAGTKTRRSRRRIVLGDLAVDAMERHRTQHPNGARTTAAEWRDLVFVSTRGGPILGRNLLRTFHALLRRANLPQIRFHDLRHTTATLLLGEGIHPKIVSEMLGHASIGITLDLYSHATPTMQQQAATVLSALLAAPSSDGASVQ